MKICPATLNDVDSYVSHNERIFNSNGHEGVYFSPRPAGTYEVTEKTYEQVRGRWEKSFGEANFEKTWLVWEDSQIVGHILLRSPWLDSQMHRIELQMALEPGHRGKGLGRELMKVAIDWCKAETNVEWIDLGVFLQNERAVKLYKDFNFIEVGRLEDRYRVEGHSFDNVEMVLKIAR